eukprot:464941_1
MAVNFGWLVSIVLLAYVLQFTLAYDDIDWIYPRLKTLFENKNAIKSVKQNKPFKAAVIPYRITNYEITFLIYPNGDNKWVLSALNHTYADSARTKATANHNNQAYQEITERQPGGIKVLIDPTAYTQGRMLYSGNRYPNACKAKISFVTGDPKLVDIVANPWQSNSNQQVGGRGTSAMKAVMQLLTTDLNINAITLNDASNMPCPNEGNIKLRAIRAFQVPGKYSWYQSFGFVPVFDPNMDAPMASQPVQDRERTRLAANWYYRTLRSIKVSKLQQDCTHNHAYNNTVLPYVTAFNLAGNNELIDIMSHFVSTTVQNDKCNSQRAVPNINGGNNQLNCKHFKDIKSMIITGECGVEIRGWWNALENKGTEMKYDPVAAGSGAMNAKLYMDNNLLMDDIIYYENDMGDITYYDMDDITYYDNAMDDFTYYDIDDDTFQENMDHVIEYYPEKTYLNLPMIGLYSLGVCLVFVVCILLGLVTGYTAAIYIMNSKI